MRKKLTGVCTNNINFPFWCHGVYEPGKGALAMPLTVDRDPSPDFIFVSPEVVTGQVSGWHELFAERVSDFLDQVGAGRVFGILWAVGTGTIFGTLEAVGPGTVSGTLEAVGPRTVSGTLEAVGPRTVSGTLEAVGPRTVSGALEAVWGGKNTGALLLFNARTDAGTSEDILAGTILKKIGVGTDAGASEEVGSETNAGALGEVPAGTNLGALRLGGTVSRALDDVSGRLETVGAGMFSVVLGWDGAWSGMAWDICKCCPGSLTISSTIALLRITTTSSWCSSCPCTISLSRNCKL